MWYVFGAACYCIVFGVRTAGRWTLSVACCALLTGVCCESFVVVCRASSAGRCLVVFVRWLPLVACCVLSADCCVCDLLFVV